LLYLLVAPAQARGFDALALTAVAGLALSLLFAGLTLVLWRAFQPAAFTGSAAPDPQRRAFLGGGLAAVLLLVGAGIAGRNALQSQAESPQALVPLEPAGTDKPAAVATTAPPAATAAPPTAAVAPSPTTAAAVAQPTAVSVTAAPTVAASPAAPSPTAPSQPTATAAPRPEEVEERYFAAINGLGPELTPIGKFYVVDEAIDDPRVDPQTWLLTIKGHVEKPVTLTFDQLRALPFVDQYATLMCISYELGQDLISNGKWRGVRLSELLKQAGVKPGATEVVLRSVDQYSESHAMERAMQPETILAYGMNDVLLPRQHGSPLRAIVPGLYGFKHVKWLTEIEVIAGPPYQGYWQESAGWIQTGALASAMSRIDTVDSPPVKVGGKATVAGIAFTSLRGISKVEVSDDGGKTWQPGRLKRPLSPMAWSFWAFEWLPKQAGKAKLLVRAYENDGTPQVATVQPAHPNGATGYHGFDYDVLP
jgi:DMSO/TMAO reductase YedYZ molybdopterin-dependent catalytic subunit